MHPRDTQYCLALKPHHKKKAHQFAESEGYVITERLQHPTVLAVRDGAVVGMLSTAIKQKYIIATNLVLAKSLKRPVITAMRLLEAYEAVMRDAGVQFYLFELMGHDTPLQRYMTDLGLEPYQQTDQSSWYMRRLS